MQDGFVKIALVVALVAGLSGIGIYTMTLSANHAPKESGEEGSVLSFESDTTKISSIPEQPVEELPEKPTEETPPPIEGAVPKENLKNAPGIGKVKEVINEEEEFDPMLGERFPETQAPGQPVMKAVTEGPSEVMTNIDLQKIDNQVGKIKKNLTKKVNNLSARLKLDTGTSRDLLDISLDGLEQISDARKRFAGQPMSDGDRQYLKDTVRSINMATAQSIRGLLGDDKYKEYRKQSRYYDNPQERLLDEMNTLKKQNQQLQKKMDSQNRPRSRPKRSSNWRARR